MSINAMSVVILAAGKGTRMYSDIPKTLHTLAGKTIIRHILDTVNNIDVNCIHLVYGHKGSLLKQNLSSDLSSNKLNWIFQSEQLGTGHAILQAAPFFNDEEDILVLYGDTPLISTETLVRLKCAKPKDGLSLLTGKVKNPTDYGRVIRKNGKVIGIIEHKDATVKQRQIQEINTGIFIANAADLKCWLTKLTNNNAQNEYHITDIISIANQEGRKIITIHPEKLYEIRGINNRLQLSLLEQSYQIVQAKKLLLSGVMIRNPKHFNLYGKLLYGRDVEIDTNVLLEGQVTLGHRVKIGVGCVIKNSIINDDCEIKPYSILENAHLEKACIIGPFAHLRFGTKILEGAHIGNFVEVKKTCFGKNSKAGHLSYLGDAEIGNNVNIGAGTITCNYDGENKFITVIGNDVFVGSDTQFVAPVNIGTGATIAAGTTVTHDVDNNELVLSRVPQIHKKNWKRNIRIKKK